MPTVDKPTESGAIRFFRRKVRELLTETRLLKAGATDFRPRFKFVTGRNLTRSRKRGNYFIMTANQQEFWQNLLLGLLAFALTFTALRLFMS
jgi:hypothetical protein